MPSLKRASARIAAVTTVSYVLLTATSVSAFADGNVTWRSASVNECLMVQQISFGLGADELELRSDCGNSNASWRDVRQSDGSWEEISNYDGECLTAYKDNTAYLESCKGPNGNAWEHWREINTGNGWKLQNVATGLYLTDEGDFAGAFPASGGANQIWH